MSITLTQSKSSLGILAGIEGSVPFVSPVGTLIEDNPKLFWDDANNRLGIGTDGPVGQLHISQDSTVTGATLFLERVDASVTAPNSIGLIGFLGGEDGTSEQVAAIIAEAEEAWTATSSATGLVFSTTPSGATNDTERMRIGSSGNVGIGVTDPDAKLEINGQIKITGGNPANSRYLRSDANGLATWGDVGWTDLGTDVVLLNSNDNVGIGTPTPSTKLEVIGGNPGNVGGFPSGGFQIRGPGTTVNSNAVITGHNSFGGNTQLWYLGSTASANQNIALINRQNAELHLHTNNTNRLAVKANGTVDLLSTTGAFIPNRLTTTQRDALTAVNGMIIYNTTLNKFQGRENGAWVSFI